MDFNFIFPAALFVYLVVYAVLVGGFRGSVKHIEGHTLLVPMLLWLIAATATLYFFPHWLSLMPLLGAFKLLSIGYFFRQTCQNNKATLFGWIAAVAGLSLLSSFMIGNIMYATQFFSAGMLICCVLLLLWNEALYRESDEQSTKVKPVFFATGIFLVVDVIWLTDALIDGHFSIQIFYLRGMVAILMAPLLLKGLLALQHTPLLVSLSRSALFHSSILMLCGVYLLLIGLMSSAMQFSGIQLKDAGDVIILSVLLTPLSVVFVSTRLRRLIRVKISKHLFSEQFDYRKLWLQFASLFHQHSNSTTQETFCALLKLLHHQRGAYCTLHQGRPQFVVCCGHDFSHISRDIRPLFGFLTETGWVLDAAEAKSHADVYPAHIRACLMDLDVRWVIPVVEHQQLSAILLIDTPDLHLSSPWMMNWELKDFLLTVAKQWHWHVQAKNNAEQLSQQARLSTFTQTAAFVLHDLKNIDAQIGMLAENGKQFKRNQDFVDDAFESINHIKARLQKVLLQLSAKQYSNTFGHADNCSLAALEQLLLRSPDWSSVTHCNFEPDGNTTILAPLDKLHNVICHLLRNAKEACAISGRHSCIELTCTQSDEDVMINIRDNGCGMSQDYIQHRLFKPLETTKGNAGMGLGVFDAHQFTRQYGGSLSVKSDVDVGTEFSLILPKGTGA